MLRVRIRHSLGAFALDARFEAPPGINVLFGRSGSGKTSIINSVAGLLEPDEAHIILGDRVLDDTERGLRLPVHKRRIGYIFQEGRLFPHLSVAQNLDYGAREGPDRARIIEMLGLGDLLARRPSGLSGGEAQRVAIGRALLSAPDLLLADEPLTALDAARKEEILPYFERLRDEMNVPMLYVSHAAGEVARLATTVIAIEEGKVIRQGPAQDVLGDASVLPAGVRAAGAVLPARIVAHHRDGLSELDAGGIALHLPRIDRRTGEQVRVRIAAQDVMLSSEAPRGLSALNILPGRILDIREGAGPGVIVTLETAAGRILARVTRRSARLMGLSVGMSCHAVVKSVSIAPGDAG